MSSFEGNKARPSVSRLYLATWLALLSFLCGSVSAGEDGYGLQPGDILEISVWQDENLQREAMVRPDGKISFPLVGDVQAQGRTIGQVGESIVRKLDEYIPDPVVTVSLREIAGDEIYVLGRVGKPGAYVVTTPVDVMRALALAGGLTPFASRKDIKVLRREKGTQRQIPFNYKQVERGKNLEQNIILQAGDVVVVP